MYQVAHRNGQGIYSDYYIDISDIPTLSEAKQKAREFRAANPASNGWYAIISVLDNDGTAVFSPDFDSPGPLPCRLAPTSPPPSPPPNVR